MSDVEYGPEQLSLAEALASVIGRRSDDGSLADPRETDRRLWLKIAGNGLLELPREAGGSAESLWDYAAAWEQLGSSCTSLPFIETSAALMVILPRMIDARQREEFGKALIGGAAVRPITHAQGGRALCRLGEPLHLAGQRMPWVGGYFLDLVPWDREWAMVSLSLAPDHALISAGRDWIGGTTRADVHLPSARPATIAVDRPALDVWSAYLTAVSLGYSMKAVGGARCALGASVAHVQERKQFGLPIAMFQAVRHRLADMLVLTESADALARRAVRQLGCDELENQVYPAAARLLTSDVHLQVARHGVQLHGAMGFTFDSVANRQLRLALDDFCYPSSEGALLAATFDADDSRLDHPPSFATNETNETKKPPGAAR